MNGPVVAVAWTGESSLDGSFLKYCSASVISALGDGVATLAIPAIAVSVLHADSIEVGVLNALSFAPTLLFSVHAGGWVDSTGRHRDAMVLANIGSTLAFGSIPLAWFLGVLNLPQLCIATFVAGGFSALFIVCDNSLFVDLVPPKKYIPAQSILFGGLAVASLAGPALGGLFIQLFSAPSAPLFDASTYIISATLLGLISRSRLPAYREPDMNHSIRESLDFLWRNRTVRAVLSVTTAANFFNSAFQALQVLYLVDTVGASIQLVGWLLTSVAVGGLLGSVLATPITTWVGSTACLTVGSILIAAPLAAVMLVHHIDAVTSVVLIVAIAGSGLGRVWQNVSAAAIFTVSVPDTLRSRTRGAFQMVSSGARPLGALLGGLLGASIGLRPTLWLAVIGGVLFSLVTAPKRGTPTALNLRCQR
jgi:MFS family permease